MTNPTIIGAGIAFALIALAIATLIWVVRLMRRPTRRAAAPNPAVEPPTAPVIADQAASLPIPPSTPALAPSLPYARIAHLLSPAEGDFFAALQAAAPAGMLLFAQVRLANLVEVQRWARGDKSHWWRIRAKCVDFVLCEPRAFAPRLVVELDDSSHNRADRRERDAFVDEVLASAGIPILHIRWQRRYDVAVLAGQIAAHLGMTLNQAVRADAERETQPHPVEEFWKPIATTSPVPVTATLPLAPATPHHAPTPQVVVTQMPAPLRHACGQCQADLRENAKFCTQCGAVCPLG